MSIPPEAAWIALALALPCSLLAIGGTAWVMFRGRGPRMAQYERNCNGVVSALGERLVALEGNLGARLTDGESVIRSLSDEAQELFKRARAERKRTDLAAHRIETVEERPDVEPDPLPVTPAMRRAIELQGVAQRLAASSGNGAG